MKYEVIVLSQALSDLLNIYEYIALVLGEKQNATNQIQRIRERINSLEEFPERCPKYPFKKREDINIRIMGVDKYVVLYSIDKKKKRVTILRVFASSRDLSKQSLEA